MNKNKKKIGRRRSKSLTGFASKDLCETIPKSVDSSQRLLMLVERSFQYALNVVQKNFLLNETFDVCQFQKEGVECWEKVKSVIEEQNLCKAAVTEDIVSNQSLLAVQDGIKEKAMLEAEIVKWDERLAYYREELKKETNNPSTIPANWKGKEMLFDYSDIIEDTSSTHTKLQKQIGSLRKTKTSIKKRVEFNQAFNNDLLFKCEKYFEPKKRNTPKTLARKIEQQ